MNINRVVITGNLTADPDLKTTPSGTSVCKLRIASNERVKDSNGEWGERPNYFTVTVWGAQGENCNRYLAKGRVVLSVVPMGKKQDAAKAEQSVTVTNDGVNR